MVAEGQKFLLDQWWVATFPGIALFLLVIGFNLIGESLSGRMQSGLHIGIAEETEGR
jgi:ABC-type dipeptide/oligopeptide/nickel transport system permease subunit